MIDKKKNMVCQHSRVATWDVLSSQPNRTSSSKRSLFPFSSCRRNIFKAPSVGIQKVIFLVSFFLSAKHFQNLERGILKVGTDSETVANHTYSDLMLQHAVS